MAANRAVRRKREAGLAKARKVAAEAVAILDQTPEDDPRYHERATRAGAFTATVALMEGIIEEDAADG